MKNLAFKLSIGISLLIFMGLASCGGQQNLEQQAQQQEELNEWISDTSFTIEHRWMNPLRGQQISLIGNPNFIRMKDNQVEIFLPYFGVRQLGGSYGMAKGIEFEGKPENLEITQDEQGEYTLEFEAHDRNENYQFRITIYPNHNVRTYVTSSQRDNISYDGTISGTEEEATE